jgi:hypothetical protein
MSKDTVVFRCAIPGCGASHIEPRKGNYDQSRLAYSRAKEAGWRFSKHPGRGWEAICPECAAAGEVDSPLSLSELGHRSFGRPP